MIVKYGMQWPDGVSELDIELWCYAHDSRPEGCGGRMTRWDHFKNAADMLWNKPSSNRKVIWNAWTNRMIQAMIQHKYVGLAGAGSCVSGDTRILDPLTGYMPTIKDLAHSKDRPLVMTLHGPRRAEVPYYAGSAVMLEFKLGDGSSFKCTEGHRILTPAGWRHASQAIVGDSLYGYAPYLPRSTSDNDPSNQPQGAHHCFGKAEDLMAGYSACCHLCGEQLQSARESDQSSPPLPVCAQRCSESAFVHSDAPCDELEYNHPYPPSAPSRSSGALRYLRSLSRRFLRSRFAQGISSLLPSWFSRPSQSRTGSILLRTFAAPGPHLGRIVRMDYDDGQHEEWQHPASSGQYSQTRCSCRADQPPSWCCHAQETALQSAPAALDASNCARLPQMDNSYGLKVHLIQVVSITNLGEQDYYDMHVPNEEHYFAEGVIHHNSGKSDSAAVFAIVEWLSAPSETLFLVCSTTTKGARLRIWKSITELWNSLEAQWLDEGKLPPGKMVQSDGHIKGMDATGKWSDGLGILLIAAGKDDEAAADKKLKGAKAPSTQDPLKGGRLRLIADEFSDLGMCVYTALVGNLSSNEDFKAIGMSNPGSKLTPFARFVTPRLGWNSLSVGMTEWETELGICLSFDSYTSPRLTEENGDQRFTWMQSRADIERMKKAFGEDSVEFWAQVRGMFCPTGMERTVWSELELLNAQTPVDPKEWDRPPDKFVAALDPAFVTEGDRSPIMWGECGTIKQKKVLNILGYKIVQEASGIVLSDDGEENQITVSENVINQFRDHCRFHSIQPKQAGFDGTGGGVAFGQWLHTKWSHAVHAIRFNEKPVDRRPDSQNEFTIYKNRVTQLWVQPKALVREGQIRGIPLEVTEELCMRKWAAGHTATTSCVETKRDMKKRIGKSPDCFVAGTMIATPTGGKAIESLRPGDVVLTPFGSSPIFAIHKTTTDELCEVATSGPAITGKPGHRLFADGKWVRMDALSIDMEIESVYNRPLWKFLNLCFTRVTPTMFKHLVDTTAPDKRISSESDCFIVSCGLKRMVRFLMGSAYTTSMASGLTTGWKILKRWISRIMLACMSSSDLKTMGSARSCSMALGQEIRRHEHGTLLQRVWHGIANMAGMRSRSDHSWSLCAWNVANHPVQNGRERPPAQKSAASSTSIEKPIRPLRFLAAVLSAMVRLRLINTAPRKHAVVAVRHFSSPSTEVFNLTLEHENAYYANGLLVDNCADAFVILVEVCILNGLLDVQEIRKDDRKINQDWKRLVSRTPGFSSDSRKNLVAMPKVKRLTVSRRR